jgi:hypothetical protein
MTKKKVDELVEIRITGPDCRFGNRLYLPGETATVPAEIAAEWNKTGRAEYNFAEVDGWQPEEQ